MKRVLLLGGTGFIGSLVLAELRRRPGLQISVLAHRRVNYRALEDVNLVVADLGRLDLDWLDVIAPDTIIHLARFAGRGRIGRVAAARRGGRANDRLIDKLVSSASGTHVVYVSGTLVYGSGGDAEIDERSPLRPTAYAREYVRAERPWMEAQAAGRLPVTIVRPPWVLGPGSWFHGFYVRPAQRDGAVPCYGDGANWMTFIDVADCGGSIVHVAEHAPPGSVVNVFAPGQAVRQAEFARVLGEALGGLPTRRRDESGARDKAPFEALTSSMKIGTVHDQVAFGYPFRETDWRTMVARHAADAVRT